MTDHKGRFKKGQPRSAKAGRKKGTPNKKTIAKKPIRQWFEDANIHPLQMIMSCLDKQKSALESIEDPVERTKAWNEITKRSLEILPYVAPKVKDVEPPSEETAINVEASLESLDKDDLMKIMRDEDDK